MYDLEARSNGRCGWDFRLVFGLRSRCFPGESLDVEREESAVIGVMFARKEQDQARMDRRAAKFNSKNGNLGNV